MARTVPSRSGVPVRLTPERWSHIAEDHGELEGLEAEVLKTVEEPQIVLAGERGTLLAVRPVGSGRCMVVVYRENSADDGFIITAFITSKVAKLMLREQVWPRKN